MDGVEHIVDSIALVVEQFLDLLAIAVVAIGACEAVVGMVRLRRTRDVWLRFAHWLVAALTFELAADVVSTTVAPTWPDLGKLAAIAGIRTFLTFFLDRDVERAAAERAA